MSRLGDGFDVNKGLATLCFTFVCRLKGKAGVDVNTSKYRIFCAKAGLSTSLPPCHDAVCWESKQCCSSVKIANRGIIDTPSSTLHGWRVEDGQYGITWHSVIHCN